MTLQKWVDTSNPYAPISVHEPWIGIHDVQAILDTRRGLWNLEDYFVSSVKGGVIWLAPRTPKETQ